MAGLERMRKLSAEIRQSAINADNIAYQIAREQSDDHEIAEWVRKNGGVESIENDLRTYMQIALSVTLALFKDACPTRIADKEEIKCELDKRLMPPGMEWPRYEDGSPVVLSEFDQNPETISCVAFVHHEAVADYDSPFVEINPVPMKTSVTTIMNMGERVKSPKQEPVGDDGLPIRRDDEVWAAKDGNGPFKVVSIDIDAEFPITLKRVGSSFLMARCTPDELTHTKPEPPDSWEKLEKDIAEGLMSTSETDVNLEYEAHDLVRRAKALAARERGER